MGPATTRKWAAQYGAIVAEVQMIQLGKFALEHNHLVQVEDDRHAEEPPRVDNTLEEDQRFSHPVLRYKRSYQRE